MNPGILCVRLRSRERGPLHPLATPERVDTNLHGCCEHGTLEGFLRLAVVIEAKLIDGCIADRHVC